MVTVDRRINENKVKFEELNPGDAFFRREKYFDGKLYIKLQKKYKPFRCSLYLRW